MSSGLEPLRIQQQLAEAMAPPPEQLDITVKNITGRVFLNQPEEDLIPTRYLRKAKQTATVRRKAWIFRDGAEDGREVNLDHWSKVDIRYRGVFKALAKCPKFDKGLWEDGSESCEDALENGMPKAQGHVVYALLDEIGEMLNESRETLDEEAIFYLTPRLVETTIEYWTGYRVKHRDGPKTAGFLGLEYHPVDYSSSLVILPVNTTMEAQTLEQALEGKLKLMLGQLLHHVRPLNVPGDKVPDQEIFLIGLHGSKLHLMRAFFPGQKLSSIWCRREVPGPQPLPFLAMYPPSGASVPIDQSANSGEWETDDGTTDEHVENVEQEEVSRARTRSNTNPFAHDYTDEEIERLRQHLEVVKLARLDNEPDLHTFRILATREYDLWLHEDFKSAVQMLSGLHLYLLSGQAQCGNLQETFFKHPYLPEEYDSESPDESGPETEARIRQNLRREQREIEEEEENLRREEIIRLDESARAARERESMLGSRLDNILSLRDARRRWWDFVWPDSEPLAPQSHGGNGTDEADDMIVGNLRG